MSDVKAKSKPQLPQSTATEQDQTQSAKLLSSQLMGLPKEAMAAVVAEKGMAIEASLERLLVYVTHACVAHGHIYKLSQAAPKVERLRDMLQELLYDTLYEYMPYDGAGDGE